MLIGHQKQWNFLKKKFQLNQLSHVYLFTGPDEIGKKKFAFEFTKLINCIDPHHQNKFGEGASEKNKPTFACELRTGKEECQNCKLIEKEKHPDVLMVKPKEDKSVPKSGDGRTGTPARLSGLGEIEIAQIRGVQQFLSLKPYYGSLKTVIVDEAEKMNQEAQSCFLKTLEEPKGRTLLILISSKPEMLLPTILSRCQTVKFFLVSLAEIKNYLIEKEIPAKKAEMLINISDGKPGRVIKFLLEPDKITKEKKVLNEILEVCNSDLAAKFRYVKNLQEVDFSEIIDIFKRYFRELLLFKIGINGFGEFDYFPPPSEKLKSYSLTKLKEAIRLAEIIGFRLSTTNVNPKLALEILLLNC